MLLKCLCKHTISIAIRVHWTVLPKRLKLLRLSALIYAPLRSAQDNRPLDDLRPKTSVSSIPPEEQNAAPGIRTQISVKNAGFQDRCCTTPTNTPFEASLLIVAAVAKCSCKYDTWLVARAKKYRLLIMSKRQSENMLICILQLPGCFYIYYHNILVFSFISDERMKVKLHSSASSDADRWRSLPR